MYNSKGTETRLDCIEIQLASFIHVKVTEHHGKLLEGILGNVTLVSGLDLLLQVVTNPHGHGNQLVSLLSQANGGVLRAPIVEDQLFLQDSSKILIPA